MDNQPHDRGVEAAASGGPALTLPDFQAWIGRARLGETLEYYRGDLAYDRECRHKTPVPRNGHHGMAGRCGACERCVLDQYATMILTYGGGSEPRVHLVQRRHERSDYSYIAVKSES